MNTEVRDTPRTEAGRALLGAWHDEPDERSVIGYILAIEAEAAASPAPDRGLREALGPVFDEWYEAGQRGEDRDLFEMVIAALSQPSAPDRELREAAQAVSDAFDDDDLADVRMSRIWALRAALAQRDREGTT